MNSRCRCTILIGVHTIFLILTCLSLGTPLVGALSTEQVVLDGVVPPMFLLQLSAERFTHGGVVSRFPPEMPEVHHDGVRVLQALDKCPTGGPNTLQAATDVSGEKTLAEQTSLKNPFSSLVLPPYSTLEAASNVPTILHASSKEDTAQKRRAFACAAGCSAQEPQLEVSLSPWADWKTDSSGLEMIDAMEGFCAKRDLESKDPFVISVLWKGDVYLKPCRIESLGHVGLYLIGPEDLSLVLIMLFGAQHIGQLPEGPITFGMYLSDYTSLLDHHLNGPGLPIFSYLGRDTSWLIPWPSSFNLIATKEVEEWQSTQEQNADGVVRQKPFEDRESKAYWIGAVTGPWEFALDDGLMAVPRMKLLKMAKDQPKELQAEWSTTAGYGIEWLAEDGDAVSGFNAARPRSVEELTGAAKSGFRKVEDWENYKYYINLDGVVMGGRITKLLSLGGVVLQHQAGYIEHVNALMKPFEHYVPIEYDLSDLVEKVQWLQENPAEAKRIAENGRKLSVERMRFEDNLCYVWRALEGLASKTASTVADASQVEDRLSSYIRTSVQDGGMRPTMETFWGQVRGRTVKLEEVKTGDRELSHHGIKVLQWAWNRMEGLYKKSKDGL